jgi:double-strand break repair protein MRE11
VHARSLVTRIALSCYLFCLPLTDDPRYQNSDRPELPLIRLRVEFTGFTRITNINKFGQKFVGKVANPEDLLLFSKQKKVAARTKGDKAAQAKEDDTNQRVDTFLQGGDHDKPPPIHELVKLLIRQVKGGMNVLTEGRMADMVDAFVNKKEIDSISTGVASDIKKMAQSMREEKAMMEKDTVSPDEVERSIRKKHGEMTAIGKRQAA